MLDFKVRTVSYVQFTITCNILFSFETHFIGLLLLEVGGFHIKLIAAKFEVNAHLVKLSHRVEVIFAELSSRSTFGEALFLSQLEQTVMCAEF